MSQQPICANCGIAIRWQPTIVDGITYCCLGCAQGGPCECDYENLPQPGELNAIVSAGASQREHKIYVPTDDLSPEVKRDPLCRS